MFNEISRENKVNPKKAISKANKSNRDEAKSKNQKLKQAGVIHREIVIQHTARLSQGQLTIFLKLCCENTAKMYPEVGVGCRVSVLRRGLPLVGDRGVG